MRILWMQEGKIYRDIALYIGFLSLLFKKKESKNIMQDNHFLDDEKLLGKKR